ncbi:GMC family oxidoreductase [Sulfitobacter geojensis]|uniref:GMC family oxidoreductase n=1 Tax=Sulfitobacter geojensis TaxID=1342299 RepID=UPI0007DA2CFC|nr:GMC family oxidoreductase N-terminal domain-containing protein [Sulfitobacter geojensis]OAN96453.1 glucose-methanol-choline oxidoreductase [Sulfitobacter geojensis]
MNKFDYIVVGGGSAGCVAAARLVAESGGTVLLLEAGHSNRHPLLDMPPGIFKMINGSKFMKYHRTTPQAHLDDRVHDIPQGNVLGGGSSVNAQVYMRGRPDDYDQWNEILRGNNDGVGWGWKDVLPHFTRMENNNRFANNLHGVGGALQVSDPGHIDDMSRWFVQSVQSLGEPFNPDFNGPTQRGVGFYQFTNRKGKRSSAAYAFISPQLKNPRLTVKLGAEVDRIIIEDGRAVGISFRDKAGVHQTRAKQEIVLAAGALVTPKLLMLSGIGPADHLAEHGIKVKADLAGVGQNLIDHPEVPITAYANGPYGYYKQGDGWRMIRNGLQFKMFGSGPVTSAGVEAGAFVNPNTPGAPPTIQAFCVPIVYLDRDAQVEMKDGYGITITTVVVKPKSRGEVRLVSSDPSDMPEVSPNLLKDPADMAEMVAGQRFFLNAMQAEPLAKRLEKIVVPNANDVSDKALIAHCKRFVKTNYHPAGTAKMGADGDKLAVLDAQLRVRSIDGLRVCDMSAVPDINAGNTNAPAMMLGDRCADLIMGQIG